MNRESIQQYLEYLNQRYDPNVINQCKQLAQDDFERLNSSILKSKFSPNLTIDFRDREWLLREKSKSLSELILLANDISIQKIYKKEISMCNQALEYLDQNIPFTIEYCTNCKCNYIMRESSDRHWYHFDQDVEYKCIYYDLVEISVYRDRFCDIVNNSCNIYHM